MDRRRLLQVIHYPVFGGPHNQALRLAEPLARRGWDTIVLLPKEQGNAAARLRMAGIPVVEAPLGRLRAVPDPRLQLRFAASFRPDVARIRRIIRHKRIDLVVVSGLVNPHAAIAARLERVPVVWQILDTRAPMKLRQLLMPLVTRLSDAIMSTGVEVARVHPGALALGDRLVPFFPPVDTQSFRPDLARRATARRTLGVPDDAHLIGTLGNLNPQKGHEYLLRAAAVARQSRPDVVVRVLGADTPTQADYAAGLRAEALALRLLDEGGPLFVDPGACAPELLPAFDLFVMTSVPRSEGAPTAILEAMACGLPVVTTDVGAVREMVEEGETGFVTPPLDPPATADAILRVLADDSLRTRMAAEARGRALQRYDVDVCADTHLAAFEAALAHHGRRARHTISADEATPR